jgi:hypothetical protein
MELSLRLSSPIDQKDKEACVENNVLRFVVMSWTSAYPHRHKQKGNDTTTANHRVLVKNDLKVNCIEHNDCSLCSFDVVDIVVVASIIRNQ